MKIVACLPFLMTHTFLKAGWVDAHFYSGLARPFWNCLASSPCWSLPATKLISTEAFIWNTGKPATFLLWIKVSSLSCSIVLTNRKSWCSIWMYDASSNSNKRYVIVKVSQTMRTIIATSEILRPWILRIYVNTTIITKISETKHPTTPTSFLTLNTNLVFSSIR